jgi:hypothetical protein
MIGFQRYFYLNDLCLTEYARIYHHWTLSKATRSSGWLGELAHDEPSMDSFE